MCLYLDRQQEKNQPDKPGTTATSPSSSPSPSPQPWSSSPRHCTSWLSPSPVFVSQGGPSSSFPVSFHPCGTSPVAGTSTPDTKKNTEKVAEKDGEKTMRKDRRTDGWFTIFWSCIIHSWCLSVLPLPYSLSILYHLFFAFYHPLGWFLNLHHPSLSSSPFSYPWSPFLSLIILS